MYNEGGGKTMPRTLLFIFISATLLSLSPATIQAWRLEGDSIQPASVPTSWKADLPRTHADLDGDGVDERLELSNGQVSILSSEETRWQSPDGWDIHQAMFGDLNHDGQIEAALLVWRRFKAWPVDQWLPSGGRIEDFHNTSGDSCHIILIGWGNGKFKEKWAGSSLAQPVLKMAEADLNMDGMDELVTLDSTYDAGMNAPADKLRVWEWNGFGFSLVSEKAGVFHNLEVMQVPNQKPILVTP